MCELSPFCVWVGASPWVSTFCWSLLWLTGIYLRDMISIPRGIPGFLKRSLCSLHTAISLKVKKMIYTFHSSLHLLQAIWAYNSRPPKLIKLEEHEARSNAISSNHQGYAIPVGPYPNQYLVATSSTNENKATEYHITPPLTTGSIANPHNPTGTYTAPLGGK